MNFLNSFVENSSLRCIQFRFQISWTLRQLEYSLFLEYDLDGVNHMLLSRDHSQSVRVYSSRFLDNKGK